jgi:hypothetical protein
VAASSLATLFGRHVKAPRALTVHGHNDWRRLGLIFLLWQRILTNIQKRLHTIQVRALK